MSADTPTGDRRGGTTAERIVVWLVALALVAGIAGVTAGVV